MGPARENGATASGQMDDGASNGTARIGTRALQSLDSARIPRSGGQGQRKPRVSSSDAMRPPRDWPLLPPGIVTRKRTLDHRLLRGRARDDERVEEDLLGRSGLNLGHIVPLDNLRGKVLQAHRGRQRVADGLQVRAEGVGHGRCAGRGEGGKGMGLGG